MGSKIIYWNCAMGVKSKLDFIKDLVNKNSPLLFFVSEAEMKTTDLNLINIRGYDVITSNSINGEFGVARMLAYVKSSIRYRVLNLDPKLDIVALDIENERFVGVYKGFKLPNGETRKSYFELILGTLKNLTMANMNITIGGDFNVDAFSQSKEAMDLDEWSI